MAKKPKYSIRADGLHEAIRIINGKRVAFRGKSDGEVERKMMLYQEREKDGRPFREVAEEWQLDHFPTLAENTLKPYRPALKRAIARFGEIPIKKIEPISIDRYIAEFSAKGMARKTVTTQRLVLNLIFSHAVVRGDIDVNPCAYVKIPKGLSKKHRQAASKDDERRIKDSHDIWLLPYVIMYTGLRKGEACALQDTDFDMARGVISVTKSVYYISNTPAIKSPKTERGVREVPILAPLEKVLKEVLPKKPTGKYLFSNDGGKTPMLGTQYAARWAKFVAETGISCTAHELRHSYATMLNENKVPLNVAQKLLGHATLSMTADVYTHLRQPEKDKSILRLNKKLSGKATTQLLHSEA